MENIKTTQRDFFLYTLSTVALYYCAGWLVSLLYDYINYAFGSIDYYAYNTSWLPDSMRWAMASLVVVFPLYILIMRTLRRDLEATPEKRELRIRKWLIYLTLSLASIAMVIDLVALLNQFLSGEFATTFFLKVLAVAVVAGLVFAYYLSELRRDLGKSAPRSAVFRWLAIILVALSVIGGFVLVGSPEQARQRRYDAQRVNDLQGIQWQIVNYWQNKQRLPVSLGELNDPISGYHLPTDPKSGESYEYRAMESAKFELCATFDEQGKPEAPLIERAQPGKITGAGNEAWSHDAGRTCFTRTIDPDLYPPTPKR